MRLSGLVTIVGMLAVGPLAFGQGVAMHHSMVRSTPEREIVTGPETITFGKFLPNGRLLTFGLHQPPASHNENSVLDRYLISLWDPNTGARLAVADHERNMEVVECSPDAKYMAAWDGDRTDQAVDGAVRIFDTHPSDLHFGDQVAVLGGPTRTVFDVAFPSDSSLVAVSYSHSGPREIKKDLQKSVRIFDPDTATEICYFKTSDDDPAYALSFSPNGRYLAGTNVHKTIIWNVKECEKVGEITESDFGFKTTWTKSSDAVVHTWPVDGFRARAYKLTNKSTLGSSAADYNSTTARLLFYPSGLTGPFMETGHIGDEIEITIVGTDEVALRLHRSAPPPNKMPPTLEITWERVGVHDISNDARFALVDSQVVDLKERTVRLLDLLPEQSYRPWKLSSD